jgi:hypothetical protein
MMKKYIQTLIAFLAIFGAAGVALAWTGPTVAFPGCTGTGCSAPVNVGTGAQAKAGNLGLNGVYVANTFPNPKASLDLSSGTDKGFLPPRLTTAERNNLATDGVANATLQGMTVYNKTTNGYQYFDGTNWKDLATGSGASSASGVDGPSFSVNRTTATSGSIAVNTWTPVVFDAFVGSNSNTDPCAGVCPSGPWGFSLPGTFRPSVSGRYILSGNVDVILPAGAATVYVAIWKNGSIVNYNLEQLTSTAARYTPLGVTAVVDANAGDTFNFQVYSTLAATYSGSTLSYFSGSRVGNPATSNVTVSTTNIVVPSGAVMNFNTATCPTGWTEFTQARGRYIVGLPASGTLAAVVGTALANTENRATGAHTHGVPALAGFSANLSNGGNSVPLFAPQWYIPGGSADTATRASNTGAAAPSSGTGNVAGTNAPYIQLLACIKS